MQDQILKLASLLPLLSKSDRDFAASLVAAHNKYGYLTPKQAPWVTKLIERAESPTVPAPVAEVGEFSGVTALFEKAAKKLKYPAIVLQLATGQELRLSRASNESQNPGYIYAKVAGIYAGKISPAGALFGKIIQPMVDVLKNLAADPAGVAAAHGKLTGKCCFCNSALTDKKSTDVGYGPVCAKHYDLPWGSTPAANSAISAEHAEIAGNEACEAAAEAVELDYDAVYNPPIQTHLPEPEPQLPVAAQEEVTEEEAQELIEDRPSRKIEFDKTPGQAVSNLLKALHG